MSVLDLQSMEPSIQELVDRIEQNKSSDPEAVLRQIGQLQEYAESEGKTDLYAYALFSEAYCLYRVNNTVQSFLVCEKAIKPLIESKQWELLVRTYNTMGIISSSQGNTPIAMDYYLRGLSVCEKHDITSGFVMINCNIGMLYMGFHDLQNAERYFQSGIEHAEKVKRQQGDYEPTFSYETVSTLYFNAACTYLQTGAIEKAIESLKVSAELERKAPNDSLDLCIQMMRAQILHALGKQEELDRCVQEIDESRVSLGAITDAFDDIVNYASFLQSIGKNTEFFHTIARMEESVRITNSTYFSRKLVQLKVNFYKENNQHKEYLLAAGLYYELSMKMEQEMEKSYRQNLSTRVKLENEKRTKEELKSEAANLKLKSEFDALTGLRNRYKITEISENSYSDCQKNQRNLAVEILDVDYFKQFNDNYGHQEGDNILVKVAAAIRSLERHRGVYTGRYGGDEFIIIYVDRTYDEVVEFAQELKDSVEKMKIDHGYSLISDRITLSQGVYYGVPGEDYRFWDFLHAADQALYEVKKAGRNDFCVSTKLSKERS